MSSVESTTPQSAPRALEGCGVDHVAIIVRDATATAENYRERFGLAVTSDEVLEHLNVRLVGISTSTIDVQLVEPTGPGPLQDHLDDKGEGLHHLCFRVHELEPVIDALDEDAERIFPGGLGRRTFYLAEKPNGVPIELAEGAPRR
ncbi:MAG: VOC family protein [Microcella sp.]|uniref:VOC family protein n=1 Tax=Microcella sp. TaxID=1913979 RepID=UPI0033147797